MLVIQALSHITLLELQMDAVGGLRASQPEIEDCGWAPPQYLIKVYLCSAGEEHGGKEG